jgi:hypothetical protein
MTLKAELLLEPPILQQFEDPAEVTVKAAIAAVFRRLLPSLGLRLPREPCTNMQTEPYCSEAQVHLRAHTRACA